MHENPLSRTSAHGRIEGLIMSKRIKPKMNKCKKDKELYWYLNAENEKRWSFRHRYYDLFGKRREKTEQGFTTEASAYRALCEIRAKLATGNSIEVEHDKMTVGQWLNIWYETHECDWEITTQVQRKNIIKYQIEPLIGKMRLSTLDKETYKRKFINPLLKDYKPSTVRLFHRIFKVAINAAVDAEILSRNRFTKIIITDDERELPNVLSIEQLNIFLEAANNNEPVTSRLIINTLAFTGIRRGEALALKWKNVDVENLQITIEGTRDRRGYRTPKTLNSYRTIDIDENLAEQFKKYRKWCTETYLSFGKRFKENEFDEQFVYISYQTAEPYQDNSLFYSFKRLSEKLKFTVKPHTLRHTHASILLSNGVDVAVVADRLGNTPNVIWETYAHVIKESKSRTVDQFISALKVVEN